MSATTLPPTPSFNPHIPIITSSGGTAVAYKDPNSPESIMKKTTLVQAQAAVDSTFDVDLAKVEGFSSKGLSHIYFVAILLLVILIINIRLRKAKIYLFLLALTLAVLMFLYVHFGGQRRS